MILDTNALSAVADGVPELEAFMSEGGIAIPVIVLGEYRYGIAHSKRGRLYREWLDGLLASCQVLDISQTTAVWYAIVRSELRKTGNPIPSNDVWIAALARQYALPILSRDHHFDRVPGLRRVAW